MTQQQAKKIVRFGQLAKYHELLGATSVMETREVTWSELKTLRDGGLLTAGQWYRITDYQCTTTQENTQSAGHQFDIIVRADSTNTLNENAYAAHHAGDTYFANSKLEAWKLLYCLDNLAWSLKPSAEYITFYFQSDLQKAVFTGTATLQDGKSYFEWTFSGSIYGFSKGYTLSKEAGSTIYFVMYGNLSDSGMRIASHSDVITENGFGTIIYMKDEYDNECPYDFKNIQFKVGAKSQAGTVADVFYYTFSVATGTNDATVTDHSLNGDYCYRNKIGRYIKNTELQLNFNVFRNTSATNNCYSNTFGNNCYSNTFGYNCYSNGFGNNCYSNEFAYNCYSNEFAYNCYSNGFGNNCYSNTFDCSCYSNTFGRNCYYNEFAYNCYSNTFGNNCYSNTFGYNCYSNRFGNNCGCNAFGNNCIISLFGNNCHANTFGNSCKYVKFGTASETKSYYRYIIVENGNMYLYLDCSATTSSSAYFQNVKIAQGVNNTSAFKTITHATAGDTFQTVYKPANSVEVSV